MKTSQMLKVIPVATLALLVSCSSNKSEETAETQDEKVKVKVETVFVQDAEQLSEFATTVEVNIKNNITPQTPFRIEKIFAEVGDHIKAGQLLVKVDATSLKQAKVQSDNQKIELRRIDELCKVGGASKSAWDTQKTSLKAAREAYRSLVENTQLLGPINGIVTTCDYDSDDMYSGRNPIYTAEEIRLAKLIVNVSESLFTRVKEDYEIDIRLDVYGDKVFKGKVNLVYPTIDSAARTLPVKIKVANSDEQMRPGVFARVTVSLDYMDCMVTPDHSIVKQPGAGSRYIYVCKDDRVSCQEVKLGRRMGDEHEIISGMEDSNQMVITGQGRLTNSVKVGIENE